MKITQTRVLDTGPLMKTTLGKESPDFPPYLALFIEQTIANLRNGLDFGTNINCELRKVTLTHGTAQIVKPKNQVVTGCFVLGVESQTYLLSAFNWYTDNNSNFTVCARFATQSDATTISVSDINSVHYTVSVYQDLTHVSLPVALVILF